MTEHRCWPWLVTASVELAVSVVLATCFVILGMVYTHDYSILGGKHQPVLRFCYEGEFGNGCWNR
jgi:hypothetical protein